MGTVIFFTAERRLFLAYTYELRVVYFTASLYIESL